MSKQSDLIAVFEGETPERTPYVILDWGMDRAISSDDLASRMQSDDWKRLLDMGLTIRHHCPTVRAIEHGVEHTVEERDEGGKSYRIETKTTPLGSIHQMFVDGWSQEHWVKSAEDYKVQQWIVENTELVADYDAYTRAEEVLGEHGVIALTGHGLWLHRSPMMTLNIDYIGSEQFCMDMAMDVPEFHELYEAQKKLFFDEQHLIAAGPGRYVFLYENITVNMFGPQRYADLLLPVYREVTALYESSGKRVAVHYDGALSMIANQVGEAPYHMIDSLTESPEGDMTYDQCRKFWPEKTLLGNINVDLYSKPEEVLRQAVIDKRQRGGKRAFALQISEDTPPNWRDVIPVVLNALKELERE